MPRTIAPEVAAVEEAVKVRGIIQITQNGDMWDCRTAIYNSERGFEKATLTSEKVVELFKVCGVLQPSNHAESHVVEFFDGPDHDTLVSFGFNSIA